MTADLDFPSLTAHSLDEARSLKGILLRRELHNREATRLVIHRFIRGIGDRNPLYDDETYARASRYGGILAPPCWLYSVDTTVIAPKLPGIHAIYAGGEWEFHQPIRVGDSFSVAARLLDAEEKEGRFCGRMVLQNGEVLYRNQRDEIVARAVSFALRTPRNEAVRRGKYASVAKYRYSPQELQAIEDAYDAEVIRGAEVRYWEDVQEGETIQPVVKGPLTSEDMLLFINATCPVMGFRRFLHYRRRHPAYAYRDPDSNMWDVWEDSMLEDKVAQRFGFPAAHDSGIQRICWLGNLMTNWMGDDAQLRRLGARIVLPNIYAGVTWCKGRVIRKYVDQKTGERLVDCSLWCENERGEQSATGHATVALLARGQS